MTIQQAGLHTTANDLVRLLVTINRRGLGPNSATIWNNDDGVAMLTQQTPFGQQAFGLGVALGTNGASGQSYSHTGGNVGFNSYIWGNPVLRNGVAVLSNHESASATPAVINSANRYISQFGL